MKGNDSVSKKNGLIRLKVSMVAAGWIILWCYIGLKLDDKYRSDEMLETCMIIGIAGLYPIFGFLVTVLERRAFTGQSDTSTTKDHDWSIDFDENDSCDVVTESDLLARHEVNEKVIDPGDMASRVRNFFSGISTQKKILLGALCLSLLLVGALSMFTGLQPEDGFKPKTRADLPQFQMQRSSATAVFFTQTLPMMLPAVFICVVPLYLFISGKVKYDQGDGHGI